MKNILKTTHACAYITPDGSGYMVIAEWDVTQEEVEAAIRAEEELEKYRRNADWN